MVIIVKGQPDDCLLTHTRIQQNWITEETFYDYSKP